MAGIIAGVCGLALSARAQEVALPLVMRGGAEVPKGSMVAVDATGVVYTTEGKREALSWDRVAEVKGAFAGEGQALNATAEKAWRARTRLERLDYVAAEPLFEELLGEFVSVGGPTGAMVAEGALRCRLRRGVQTGAVLPWLQWLDAADGGTLKARMEVVQPPGSAPLVDAVTGLCPWVPPVWLRLPSVEALARGDLGVGAEQQRGQTSPALEDSGTPSLSPKGDLPKPQWTSAKAAELERLYVLAAAFEAGSVGEVAGAQVPLRHPDPGVALVAQIVGARAGTAELRREARRLLEARLEHRQAQWMEAWVRVGIGRSLLREPEAEDQLLGVAQMLHVPARLRGAAPYLAGVALASAAVHEGRSNPTGAWNLKRELTETLAGHPALDLESLRRLRRPGPGTAGSGAGLGSATEIKADEGAGAGRDIEPGGQGPEEAK